MGYWASNKHKNGSEEKECVCNILTGTVITHTVHVSWALSELRQSLCDCDF